MISNIFEATKTINGLITTVFDSETANIAVKDAVYMGFSFANIGSASCTVTIETKAHPGSQWLAQSPISNSAATNVSNSFFRQVVNTSTAGLIAANTVGFISVVLKFVYAVRIRAVTSGSSNTAIVRGNIKLPKNINYEEVATQEWTAGTVTGATQPTWVDVTKHSFMSCWYDVGGTGTIATIPANTIPGIGVSTSGMMAAVRFYPGDTSQFYIDLSNLDAMEGAKTSIVIQSTNLLPGRKILHRYFVEAACEIGFLWNMTSPSLVKYLLSWNG